MKQDIAKIYAKNKKEVKISWEDVEHATLKIVHAMKKDHYQPDIIISLARSGLIPAAMISYTLGNKQLYFIKAELTKTQRAGKDQDFLPRPVLTQRIKRSLKGHRLLVVDEMTVSGATLELVSGYLKTKKPLSVKYAVLFKQPWSHFKPDYYGKVLTDWPLYPWKDLRNNIRDPRSLIK